MELLKGSEFCKDEQYEGGWCTRKVVSDAQMQTCAKPAWNPLVFLFAPTGLIRTPFFLLLCIRANPTHKHRPQVSTSPVSTAAPCSATLTLAGSQVFVGWTIPKGSCGFVSMNARETCMLFVHLPNQCLAMHFIQFSKYSPLQQSAIPQHFALFAYENRKMVCTNLRLQHMAENVND